MCTYQGLISPVLFVHKLSLTESARMLPNRSSDIDRSANCGPDSPFRCASNSRWLELNWRSLGLDRVVETHEDGEYATVIDEIESAHTETEPGPRAAPETLMDRITRCEREEYERLINDRTRIYVEDSPETLYVDSSSDSEVQASGESATDSDLESDSCECTSNRTSDVQAYPSEELGGRRAYMLERQLWSRRRTAHLLALGRLGFPMAGYIVDDSQLASGR